MKKITLIIIMFIQFIFFTACQENYYNPDATDTYVNKSDLTYISITGTSAFLEIGECISLQAEIVPESEEKIKFSSSDEDIAYVDKSGGIYAVSAGNAVITASTDSGLTAKCSIIVNKLRKMNVSGSVPLTASDGETYNVAVDFENCVYPTVKVIADCGGGTISSENDCYTYGKEAIQYSAVGETSVSFIITGSKEINYIRIVGFDRGKMIDVKEYAVSKPTPDLNDILNRLIDLEKFKESYEADGSEDS